MDHNETNICSHILGRPLVGPSSLQKLGKKCWSHGDPSPPNTDNVALSLPLQLYMCTINDGQYLIMLRSKVNTKSAEKQLSHSEPYQPSINNVAVSVHQQLYIHISLMLALFIRLRSKVTLHWGKNVGPKVTYVHQSGCPKIE